MARRYTVALVCALAMTAGAFRFTAPPGPGLDPDAMSYLGAARTLARDGTLRVPVAPWTGDQPMQGLTHFPPGYSAAIAAAVRMGATDRDGARLVQAIAAGATLGLFVVVLWPLAGGAGATLGALALALLPAFVQVQLSVLSEPLFLALLMLLLWSLVRRPRAALAHGLLAAAATMVRYAGLSFAGGAALWALADGRASWRDRLRRAALAVTPSVLAMAAWSMTRPQGAHESAAIRHVALYLDWMPTVRQGAQTIAHLLAPTLEWEPVPWLAAGATLAALVAMVWSTVRLEGEVRPEPEHDDPRWGAQRELLRATGCLAVAYVALILAARTFADPDIPLDFRLLVPLALLAVAAITVVAARSWRAISVPARVFGALALTGWMATASAADWQLIRDAAADGGDFASRTWRESPTLAWVRAQEPSRAIYANWPCAVWFHLDRVVHDLPLATDAATMRRFAERLRATGGVVVLWTEPSPDVAPIDTLVTRVGLTRIAAFSDGAVYAVAPAPPPQ